MDSQKFLTVLYASEVDPVQTSRELTRYEPPTTAQIARMPQIPAGVNYEFTHVLALQIGHGWGKDPSTFQATENLTGVNLMVCRHWRFHDGYFENAETIVWPGIPSGSDILVYDPAWPWMKLVIPRPDAKKIRRLTQSKLLGVEDIERAIRESHDWDGKYTWLAGEFRILTTALAEDIKDTRSPLQKSNAKRFERDRLAHQEYRARRILDNSWRGLGQVSSEQDKAEARFILEELEKKRAAERDAEHTQKVKPQPSVQGDAPTFNEQTPPPSDNIVDAEFEDIPDKEKPCKRQDVIS